MNKIIHRFQLTVIYGAVFLLPAPAVTAQFVFAKGNDLWVMNSVAQLQKTVRLNEVKAMTDLKKKIPGIVLDLRYSGENNFMHQQLYPRVSTTYLRKSAAEKLALIQKELNQIGIGLKIFDAYRPYTVTEKIWAPIKNDLYTASPKKGSGHNRGIAVDLTLVNLVTMEELNMGTGFDNFSDSARHSFKKLKKDILRNRALLRSTMEKHGFKASHTEWWHYSLHHAKYFELLDIAFEELEKYDL